MSRDWREARETNPPITEDLSRVRRTDGSGYSDLTASGEPITVKLNDRVFRVPPGTRYFRHGVTQEGLMVEYQDADGNWETAREVTP